MSKPKFKTCAVKDCDRDVTAKGLCNAHYMQITRGYSLRPVGERAESANAQYKKKCSITGCKRHKISRGLCGSHYAMAYHVARAESSERCSVPGCADPIMHRKWGLCTNHNFTRVRNAVAFQASDVVEAIKEAADE